MPSPLAPRRSDWVAILGIGLIAALQAMRTGVSVSADGVAYLDLSDAALAGRWGEFINAYWSPLFPALLAVARALVGETPQVERLAVLLVNASAAAASAVCYAAVLRLLEARGALPSAGPQGMLARTVCWSAFASIVLRIDTVSLTTPDLLVVAAQLAALVAVLRAGQGSQVRRYALAGGFALGVGFLSKGAVLVLSTGWFVALLVLVPSAVRVQAGTHFVAGLAIVALPWIALLSRHEGSPTAGSVAKLNLAWYVGRQSAQMPDPTAAGTGFLTHQWRRIGADPVIYDFSEHAVGAYPPWSDPTWWHAGLVPQPTLRNLLTVVRDSASMAWALFGVAMLAWLAVFASHRHRPAAAVVRHTVALALLAAAPLVVYWPVHVELRFLGLAWLCAWLAIASLMVDVPVPGRASSAGAAAVIAVLIYALAPPALGSPRELLVAVAVSALLLFPLRGAGWRLGAMGLVLVTAANSPWCANVTKSVFQGADPVVRSQEAIAMALGVAGVRHGAAVASVKASSPAAWARLGRWRITTEVASSQASAFWRMSDSARAAYVRIFQGLHASAIVGVLDTGARAPSGWTQVPGTDVVFLPLPPANR